MGGSGVCVSECVVVTTVPRHENVSLNGGSRERRTEGYKSSTNWLQLETQKPDDDRQSTPKAVRVRGGRLYLLSSSGLINILG